MEELEIGEYEGFATDRDQCELSKVSRNRDLGFVSQPVLPASGLFVEPLALAMPMVALTPLCSHGIRNRE